MTVSHAKIRIHSVIDDASMDFEYTGEYAFKDSTHLIVYTDYTGNDITKCAIQANASGILLHRSGAFSGDMFFTLENPTAVDYQADMPTARENQLIFIEKTGHTYQRKHQEVADKIFAQLQNWRKNDAV